jgi:hypothetical protein
MVKRVVAFHVREPASPETLMRFVLAPASIGLAVLVLAGCASAPAPDATSVLRNAERAMGGTELKTIRFTAGGAGGTFGQAYQPGMAWPRLNYSVMTRLADYQNGALREDFGRSRAEPTGGGATARRRPPGCCSAATPGTSPARTRCLRRSRSTSASTICGPRRTAC